MENVIHIENGDKPTPTFTKGEMSSRQYKLRSLMARENVDSVLFTSHHNINYYADFLFCSFGRPYGLVVTQNKAATISANWSRSVLPQP